MMNFIINKFLRQKILTCISILMLPFIFINAQDITSDSIRNKHDILKNIAYGVQPDWKVVESLSSVTGDKLTRSFTTNIANTLYGRVPGLIVEQGSGEVGNDSPNMAIRGLGTFGVGNGVLIIIDNFPSTESLFQQLTAQEIESVTVLKDASALAIYGNRGANGVLFVKTKRGSKSPLKVNFSVQNGFQQPIRLPSFLNSYDYCTLYNEALENDGLSVKYSDSDLNAYQNGTNALLYPDVNWYDVVLRNQSPMANYNLTAKGGSNTMNYFVLLNVASNKGLYKRTEDTSDNTKNMSYDRYNFRTNIDVTLSKYLSSEITLGGTVENRTIPGTSESSSSLFNLMASIPPNAFPVYAGVNMPGGNSLYKNPWAEITETGYVSTNARAAQTSVKLNADLAFITPGLRVAVAIGLNTYFKTYSIKSREYARYAISPGNSENLIYTTYGQNTSMTGSEDKSTQWRNYALNAFLEYQKKMGKHSLDILLMGTYDDYTITGSSLPYKNTGSGGRFTYDYHERYIAEFSFGYSGDDNFPVGKRFGFFPAGSIGWLVSNEDFFKKNNLLRYLKLRTSYGLTGNSNIGGKRYMYNQYYENGANYYFGTANSSTYTYIQGSLSNPLVTWEKEKKFNLGFEANIGGVFDVTFDYFNNNRYDILAKPYNEIPDFMGLSLPDINIGKASNKGFETSLKYTSDPTKLVNYFFEISGWYSTNKIIYNAEALKVYDYQRTSGQRINQPFVLEAIGFFSDQQDIDNSPKQIFDNVQPGDIKYKDQNGDEIIDNNDYIPFGYTNMPELTLGLDAGISYAGFDLALLFQAAFNRTVYLDGKYFHAFQNDGKVSSIALGRWTQETAATATYPRLSSSNNLNNYKYSTFWQKNGDFLKLRNLEVGYLIPKFLTDKFSIEKARLFMNGTNLFSLDHLAGIADPETVTGYPTVRTISMGINIQF